MVMDSCKHNIINYEQEYLCNKCGRVFNIDEAIELDAYNDTKCAIDIKGKTNPWLLGLGSRIDNRSKEGRRLVKIARYNNIYDQEYSLLANIIIYLRLENYAQEIFNRFKVYSKSKKDHAIASYLAVLTLIDAYNLKISESNVREAVKMYFKHDIRYIPDDSMNFLSKIAKDFGAKSSVRLLNKVLKR
jgi:hypothetical protein